jgi:Tfp pilus assembly protein PilN
MPKTTQQRTQPELQPQPPQLPSTRMETKKPKSPQRLWLLTGVLVLVLIVIVAAAWQASKSSQSTKTTPQAAQLAGGPVQATHDMDHVLTLDPVQPTHDMDHVLTVGP